jgi:hypothetical protein
VRCSKSRYEVTPKVALLERPISDVVSETLLLEPSELATLGAFEIIFAAFELYGIDTNSSSAMIVKIRR